MFACLGELGGDGLVADAFPIDPALDRLMPKNDFLPFVASV
jgi:hypothetical protein